MQASSSLTKSLYGIPPPFPLPTHFNCPEIGCSLTYPPSWKSSLPSSHLLESFFCIVLTGWLICPRTVRQGEVQCSGSTLLDFSMKSLSTSGQHGRSAPCTLVIVNLPGLCGCFSNLPTVLERVSSYFPMENT